MPGNPLVRFDEGRVGRTRKVSPSLLLYCSSVAEFVFLGCLLPQTLVTAPSLALDTSLQYLAKTPVW